MTGGAPGWTIGGQIADDGADWPIGSCIGRSEAGKWLGTVGGGRALGTVGCRAVVIPPVILAGTGAGGAEGCEYCDDDCSCVHLALCFTAFASATDASGPSPTPPECQTSDGTAIVASEDAQFVTNRSGRPDESEYATAVRDGV